MRIFEPKKILVPIDFSEISQGVLQAGVDIGKKWNAEVLVLHVARESEHIPYSVYNSPLPSIYPDYAANPLTKFREDARSRLESQLESMLRKAGGGPKSGCLLLWGDPIQDIVQTAENGNFDLIVMATHGRRGLNRMFVGSVTEQVIRRAPCPVVAIRIKGDVELQVKVKVEEEAVVG